MNNYKYKEDQIKRNIADKISEKSLKEDFPFEMRRTLHLIGQHDLVGAMMAKAMEQGDFDNLEGIGKPLDLGENPFEPTVNDFFSRLNIDFRASIKCFLVMIPHICNNLKYPIKNI
jgi:hypothetical protein